MMTSFAQLLRSAYSVDAVLMLLALLGGERAVLAGRGRNQSPAFEVRR